MLTFQIYKLVDSIINKLSKPVTTKGTKNKGFREYLPIFNSLHHSDKRFLIYQILLSRGRLIRYGIDRKQDIQLEGLGTFKFDKHREAFYTTLEEKTRDLGYEKVIDLPSDVKHELVDEINEVVGKQRQIDYFNRIKANKSKHIKPVVLSLDFNSIRKH